MRGNRCLLLPGVAPNAYPVSDRRPRGEGRPDCLRVIADQEPERTGRTERQPDKFAGQRRLEHSDAGQLRGARSYPVHLDVVSMSVPAARVVAEQQLSALLADQRRQPPGGLVHVRTDEPEPVRRIREQDRPVPAVGVAEMGDARGPQQRGARGELVQPGARAGTGPWIYHPVGGHDDDHAVSFGRQPRERAARQQRLIVGMGVERDDRGHDRHARSIRAATRGQISY